MILPNVSRSGLDLFSVGRSNNSLLCAVSCQIVYFGEICPVSPDTKPSPRC